MSPDKNVEAVRQKLLERSQVGLSKYGVTTQRADIDLVGWMKHAQEEAMDFAIYLEAAMQSHSDIATLEQENRQIRARMERLESDRDGLLNAAQRTVRMFDGLEPTSAARYINLSIGGLRSAIAAVKP